MRPASVLGSPHRQKLVPGMSQWHAHSVFLGAAADPAGEQHGCFAAGLLRRSHWPSRCCHTESSPAANKPAPAADSPRAVSVPVSFAPVLHRSLAYARWLSVQVTNVSDLRRTLVRSPRKRVTAASITPDTRRSMPAEAHHAWSARVQRPAQRRQHLPPARHPRPRPAAARRSRGKLPAGHRHLPRIRGPARRRQDLPPARYSRTGTAAERRRRDQLPAGPRHSPGLRSAGRVIDGHPARHRSVRARPARRSHCSPPVRRSYLAAGNRAMGPERPAAHQPGTPGHRTRRVRNSRGGAPPSRPKRRVHRRAGSRYRPCLTITPAG